jgi:hypothetical protein
MAEWLYSQNGQTKGPVTDSTVIKMVLSQELELDDYVMNPKEELWKKIRDVQPILDKIHEPEKAIPNKVQFGKDFFEEGSEVRIGNLYYYIPIQRFVVLSILSMGLFQIYWFYKQWFYWAHKHKQIHRSFDREVSWWFFPLMIFEKIETDQELNAVIRADFNGTLLFWMWIGCGAAINLLTYNPGSSGFMMVTSAPGIVGFMNSLIYYAGGIADIIFLIPIQRYINRVNEKLGNTYDKQGTGLYLTIAVGIVIFIYLFCVRMAWTFFKP